MRIVVVLFFTPLFLDLAAQEINTIYDFLYMHLHFPISKQDRRGSHTQLTLSRFNFVMSLLHYHGHFSSTKIKFTYVCGVLVFGPEGTHEASICRSNIVNVQDQVMHC